MSFTMYIFFSFYQGGDFGTAEVENQVLSKIVGISDATLITNIGCKLMLKDLRHVPDMRLNLTSVGKLDDVDLVNYFGGGIRKITNESLIVAKE